MKKKVESMLRKLNSKFLNPYNKHPYFSIHLYFFTFSITSLLSHYFSSSSVETCPVTKRLHHGYNVMIVFELYDEN
jgi:hypothetical protein